MTRPRIRRFPDLESLVSSAAEDLVDCVERAIGERGRCRMAMAGGSTPQPVYRLVAGPDLAARIEWDRVHVFWDTSGAFQPTDRASNYRMVHDELLARVPIPERNIHRIDGERSPGDAARADMRRRWAMNPLDRRPARYGRRRTHGIPVSRYTGSGPAQGAGHRHGSSRRTGPQSLGHAARYQRSGCGSVVDLRGGQSRAGRRGVPADRE